MVQATAILPSARRGAVPPPEDDVGAGEVVPSCAFTALPRSWHETPIANATALTQKKTIRWP